MIFKKMYALRDSVLEKGSSLVMLGKDIVDESIRIYNEKKQFQDAEEQGSEQLEKESFAGKEGEPIISEDPSRETLRKNLEKNMTVPEPENPAELARQTSLSAHKKIDHDPGENWNSNMWQRNFDNHQGN